MRRKFFWKLALAFLALLVSVLLAVDFLAERALRDSYENDGYQQLKALSRVLRLHPLPLKSSTPQSPEEIAALNNWPLATVEFKVMPPELLSVSVWLPATPLPMV